MNQMNQEILIVLSIDTTMLFNTNEANRLLVKSVEAHANDLLNARGHVLLNDVYDLLGVARTSRGRTTNLRESNLISLRATNRY